MQSKNFDVAELARFEALADRWWDPDSEFWPLHQINPIRLEWIDSLVPLDRLRVLDVGCGGGILSESMARRGAHVLGIDLAGKPLNVAALHAQKFGVEIDYQAIAAEDLAKTHRVQFDVVTCMEMLEHVPSPTHVIEACAQMVKPGGWLFVSTINRNPLAWLLAIVAVERVMKMLPIGTHDYGKFIRPTELVEFAKKAGLRLVDRKGLGYNPFTKKFRLQCFEGVDYLMAFQKQACQASKDGRNPLP